MYADLVRSETAELEAALLQVKRSSYNEQWIDRYTDGWRGRWVNGSTERKN